MKRNRKQVTLELGEAIALMSMLEDMAHFVHEQMGDILKAHDLIGTDSRFTDEEEAACEAAYAVDLKVIDWDKFYGT